MSDDEDLARAIALSLQETENVPKASQSHEPSNGVDDDELQFQRDLEAAIAASQVVESCNSPATSQEVSSHLQTYGEDPASSFLRERASLEKHRLERLKRTRNDSDPPAESSTQAAKRIRQSPSMSTEAPINVTPAISTDVEKLWEGELRQTANRFVDREKDSRPTFRLSEIIGPKLDISFAILSSYANSENWLYRFFDPRTPVVLVNQPREDGNSSIETIFPNWIKTRPFLRGGRGCMHIKLMLLFYKDGRLRVVVPTANFIEYDWRDIENTAWVQDFPLRQIPIGHDAKATDVPGTLQRVLYALNVPSAIQALINDGRKDFPLKSVKELRMRWDWAKVKVRLVASLAGKHEGWDQVIRTGHLALMKAIQDINVRTGKRRKLTVECQGSSVGTYSTQWLNEFYCSARGDSAKLWIEKSKTQRAKLPWPPIKVLFPSLQTVKDSILGFPGGGTMFCRKSQWEGKTYPRELFYDSNSKRGRVLMHSKMIIAYFSDDVQGQSSRDKERSTSSEDEDNAANSDSLDIDENYVGWAYVGSHNFTPSAWGTLSGNSYNPILNIVNYELGIIFPLRSSKEADEVACWKRPPRKYVAGKDKPWMQEEMQELMNAKD